MKPSDLLSQAVVQLEEACAHTDAKEMRRLVLEARSKCARALDLFDWMLESGGEAFAARVRQ